MMNPYQVLGINENASMEEVRGAYLTMIKKYHPDKFATIPEMKPIAEKKTREIIEAYKYISEHFNDATAEQPREEYQESTTATHEEKENTYHKTYSQEQTKSYADDKNGSSIAAFVLGMISVFIMSLSGIFFNLPITVELATSIITVVIFLVIGPILLIIYFISKRNGDDIGYGLVFLFLLSFFLFFLAPILKIMIVSAIILTIPIISIVYAGKGLNKAKDLNKKGMKLSAIGLICGIMPILMFILHYAYGVTI